MLCSACAWCAASTVAIALDGERAHGTYMYLYVYILSQQRLQRLEVSCMYLSHEGRPDRLTEDWNLKRVIVISSFFSFRTYKHLAQHHV